MRRLLRRLWRDRSGVSAVEFALILPFLTALVVGTIEFGRLILVTQKLQNGSFILADLTARGDNNKPLAESDIKSIFLALDSTMKPFSLKSNGAAMLSSVSAVAGGKTVINWQRTGAGVLSVTSGLGKVGAVAALPKELTLASGETLVVAEVFYSFQPVFGFFVSPAVLHKVAYYRPRLGTLDALKP
ncbi:MAG: TadE/TadG family type IV pilus assembly protein [Amaricoccus sp.]